MNQKKKLSTKLIILIPVFILGIFSIISNVMSVSNIRNVNRSAVQISEVSLKNVSGLEMCIRDRGEYLPCRRFKRLEDGTCGRTYKRQTGTHFPARDP